MRSKKPASGMKARSIGESCKNPLGFCKEAELAGTLTARVNGTELLLLGVMVGGEKVQVAPAGKELCKHDSAMGWAGLPVFLFKESE